MTVDERKTPPVLVLLKAINLLHCFSKEEPEHNIASLAKRLGLPKPTVHRILITLERGNLIERNPYTGEFRLGLGILELAAVVLNNLDLRREARPYLERLAADTGENVYLAVMVDGDVVYLDEVQGSRFLKGSNRVGARNPVYCTALGKVLLAHVGQEEREQYYSSHELTRKTEKTITQKDELERQLKDIARSGYAIDDEEFEEGLRCVAAPIRDHTGKVIASISIAGPKTRMTDCALQVLTGRIVAAAGEISRHLGYVARN